jgi:hypothetical protein
MPEPPLFDQLKSERKKENTIVMDMKRKLICTTIRQAQYITIPKTIDTSNIKFMGDYLYRESLIYA